MLVEAQKETNTTMRRGYDDRGYGRSDRYDSYDDRRGGKGYDDDRRGGKGYGGGQGGYGRDRGGYDSYSGGKGSSYRDYQPSRSGQGDRYGSRGGKGVDIGDGPRRRGIIASIKDSFGFIECEDSDERMFFHFSEIGDRGHRVNNGDCVEFDVGVDRRTGKSSACMIDLLPPGSVVLEEELEGRFEGVVVKELRGSRVQEAHGGLIQVRDREKKAEGEKVEEELVLFNGVDLDDIRWRPAEGDIVQFNVVCSKRLAKKKAKNIVFISPGGDREQGMVSTVKDSFGFVECVDRNARLFFHFSELIDRGHQPRVGDEVEFSVVSSDRHGQDNCARVVLLPKGTVSFDIVAEGRWRGVVSKEIN